MYKKFAKRKSPIKRRKYPGKKTPIVCETHNSFKYRKQSV